MIIDQLPTAVSIDPEDELPIEKGRLTYKATVAQLVDKSTEIIAEPYDDTSTYDVGNYCIYEGSLYRCTTAVASSEDFDPDKWAEIVLAEDVVSLKTSLDKTIIQATASAVTGDGTDTYSLAGLTSNYVVGNWGLFSDSGLTTPISENAPTCDIEITTGTDTWTITVTNFSSAFYIRPTFILKQN